MLNHSYYLIQEKNNPSTDFFIKPHLDASSVNYELLNLHEDPPELTDTNSSVIFVRYISPKWKRWIKRNADKIDNIILFIDDDIFDFKAFKSLPFGYQYKYFSLFWRHISWFKKNAQLWVSSKYLKKKYSNWNPYLLEISSPYSAEAEQLTVFYHGSPAHYAETEWLYEVITEVLSKIENVRFELIGEIPVKKLYADVEGVTVVHPMNWRSYKRFIQSPGRSIGLAPMLDSGFNHARSPVKFFDITAAGAAGIYADHPVFRDVIKHRQNGLLLPMDRAIWVEAIVDLILDKSLQTKIKNNAEMGCKSISSVKS